MTSLADTRGDLEPAASHTVVRLAKRLERERPAPSVEFSDQLRRCLLEREPDAARTARLCVCIASYASAGGALLMIAAASAAGLGPLAA